MRSMMGRLLFKCYASAESRHFGARHQSQYVGQHRWAFYESGPDDGHPIIVFHGLATDKTMMLPVCKQLMDRHKLILPDVPPFGEHSVDSSICYDESFYIKALWGFIDSIVPEPNKPVTLMGSSMGGCLAVLLALARPQDVDRLVLFAPAGVMAPEPSPFIKKAQADHSQLLIRDLDTFDSFLSVVFRNPPRLPKLLRWCVAAKFAQEMDRVLKVYADFREMLFDGIRHRLGEISVPTQLLWGTHDDMLDSSTADIFEQAVTDIEVIRLINEGHVMFRENPQATFQEVRRFLR